MNALYRAFQKLIKEELRKRNAGTLETSVSCGSTGGMA